MAVEDWEDEIPEEFESGEESERLWSSLAALRQREESGQPMTMEERRFLVEMKDPGIDKGNHG